MAERDFSEIARLGERFNKDPTSRIFVQLADAYRKNKMIEEAIDVLNQGLELHPNYPLAHLIRGKCLFDSRNFNQAKESFEKTISLDPQNVVGYRMLAQTCAFLKDNEGLISAYKGILALDPFDTMAKEKLADLVLEEKQEPMYTVSMAQEYEQQGDMKKALEIYEHLLYTDPSDLLLQQKVKALKGSLEEEEGTEPQAEATYKFEDITHESDIPPSEMEIPQPSEEKPPDVVTHEPAQKQDIISPEDILSKKTKEAPEPMTQEPRSQEPTRQEPEAQEEPEMPTPTPSETDEPIVPDKDHISAETIDSEEILKLIETPLAEEPVQKLEVPDETEDIIIERTSAVEPSQPETPQEQETPSIPEPVQEQTSQPPREEIETPVEDIEKAENVGTPSEEPPAPQEPSTELPRKPGKPKEEDFQSFKDWLSGLLK